MNKLTEWLAHSREPGAKGYEIVTAKEPITARIAAEIFVECSDECDGEHDVWVWPRGKPDDAQQFIVTAKAVWKFKARKVKP